MRARAHELELLLLTMFAAVPLYGTQVISFGPLLAFHLVMAGIVMRVLGGRTPDLIPAGLMRALAIAYIFFYVVDAAVISRSAISASTHLVLFIAAYQAMDPVSHRKEGQRLLTTALSGSDDSPVTNVRVVVKNTSPNFYTYVTGWATFYDAGAVRCGEGLFKFEALAPGESAETDTPGLRLKCTAASWRISATNLLVRNAETVKETVAAPAVETVAEKPAPVNFIISIDGEQHPIQVNNPIVLKLGTRKRKIVLRPVP